MTESSEIIEQTGDAPPPPPPTNDLGRRIDGLATVVTAVRGRIDEQVLAPAEALTTRVAERLKLSGEHTIVALAGATGSGKSSLFNALTDMELAGTGVRRPTTSWALACAWGPDGAAGLLEWMGIPARHQVSRMSMLDTSSKETSLEGLVLLDLPDHDSTEVAHHVEMDRLVQHSDMLIWVLDPQKYADAAIHERYIRPMAAFSEVTLVVLNQIDKVPYEARETALADVRRLVVEDGLDEANVVAVSATRGDGLEELKRELATRIRSKSAARLRLVADIDAAAAAVSEVAGSAAAPELTSQLREQFADDLADSAGVRQITAAMNASTRREVVQRTDWPVARWFESRRPDRSESLDLGEEHSVAALTDAGSVEIGPVPRAGTELVVRQLVDALSGSMGRPWRRAIRTAAGADGEVATALDGAIGTSNVKVGGVPWWSRAIQVLQWLLLLGVVVAGLYAVAQALESRVDLTFDVPDLAGVRDASSAVLVAAACLVGGIVLGVLSRFLARMAGQSKATKAEATLRRSISQVAEEQVLQPVEGVLAEYAMYREGLLAAQGPEGSR